MQSKLATAFHRHQARQLAPKVMCLFNSAPGIHIDDDSWLSPDATNSFYIKFRAEAEAARLAGKELRFTEADKDKRQKCIQKLAETSLGENVVVLHSLSRETGAIRLPDRKLLFAADSLISLDQDELNAVSEDDASGFSIAFNTEYNADGPEKIYEVLAWGKYDLTHLFNK